VGRGHAVPSAHVGHRVPARGQPYRNGDLVHGRRP
jgi:hypothetical protein